MRHLSTNSQSAHALLLIVCHRQMYFTFFQFLCIRRGAQRSTKGVHTDLRLSTLASWTTSKKVHHCAADSHATLYVADRGVQKLKKTLWFPTLFLIITYQMAPHITSRLILFPIFIHFIEFPSILPHSPQTCRWLPIPMPRSPGTGIQPMVAAVVAFLCKSCDQLSLPIVQGFGRV